MTTKKKSKYEVTNKAKKTKENEPKVTISTSAKSFMTFIDAAKIIGPETRVHITETGLKVFMVDIANVFMGLVELDCKVTSEEDAPKRFGIDIAHIKKLLLLSKGHNIVLTVTETKLTVSYGRFNGSGAILDHITIRKEPSKEPEINLTAHFDMPGKYLFEMSQVFGASGKIRFETEDKVIYLKTECGDLDFKEVVGTIADKNKEQIHSIYSGDYIRDIAKFVKDSPIHIDVGIDHPIIITTERDECKVRYLLAPRIEAD